MQGQEVGSSAFCGSKIKCVCLDLGGMGTMLTVRPHPLLLYNALLPLITPFPDARRARRATPHAFTTELPRLALIVILLPAHGASVTGQSRNCLLLFAVEISFRPASLDTTIYQPIPHSNSPPFPTPPLGQANYYVCLWLENWRTILQLKCEHKSRSKYNL